MILSSGWGSYYILGFISTIWSCWFGSCNCYCDAKFYSSWTLSGIICTSWPLGWICSSWYGNYIYGLILRSPEFLDEGWLNSGVWYELPRPADPLLFSPTYTLWMFGALGFTTPSTYYDYTAILYIFLGSISSSSCIDSDLLLLT